MEWAGRAGERRVGGICAAAGLRHRFEVHLDHIGQHYEHRDPHEQPRDHGENEWAQWALLEVAYDPRSRTSADEGYCGGTYESRNPSRVVARRDLAAVGHRHRRLLRVNRGQSTLHDLGLKDRRRCLYPLGSVTSNKVYKTSAYRVHFSAERPRNGDPLPRL